MSTPNPHASAPSPPPGERDAALFAQRFRRLIDVVYPASLGRPYTDTEIARQTGLSNQYVGKLRKGQSVPSLANAGRLAKLFGVSTDYFLNASDHPTVRSVERNLRMIEDHRAGRAQRVEHRAAGREAGGEDAVDLLDDDEVRQIAEGAAELPPAMRGPVRAVIDQLRKAIGLGADSGPGRT
ncbi:helix-turn-helix domain-containing protein [Streptomyces caatingaensis]|uniref:helix-turn-helix domain-containing protein n=1 Tax=Streptomyces caatingaensis TaxID=1678637 RepID=UPI0006728278|nr:helix-turn-helix domain-containing protein [Streptomyces caatingaensis]